MKFTNTIFWGLSKKYYNLFHFMGIFYNISFKIIILLFDTLILDLNSIDFKKKYSFAIISNKSVITLKFSF